MCSGLGAVAPGAATPQGVGGGGVGGTGGWSSAVATHTLEKAPNNFSLYYKHWSE